MTVRWARRLGAGLLASGSTLSAGAAFVCLAGAEAADWPKWRGPGADDVSTERSGWTGDNWPLKEIWKKGVGRGGTSPVVAGGRLYTMGWKGGKDHVYCLDAATGGEIWKQRYACPKYGRRAAGDKGRYGGPTSTPSYDPETGHLYTLSIDGDLNCWHAARGGQRVWGVNLHDAFRVKERPNTGRGRRDYGYITAPFPYGQWVIVEVGSERGNLVAFDKRTGIPRWVSECRDAAGHHGGFAPVTVRGVPCIAVLTLKRLVVVRLDSGHEGETLAQYPWQTDFGSNIASPAVWDDKVVLSSGYNQRKTVLIEISPGGARKVWETRHHTKICTPVVYQACVYTAFVKVRCLDLATGELRWKGGISGQDGSCVVTADGRLVVFGDGKLTLVETADNSPGEYKELARRDDVFTGRENWPHVVLSHGRIYCKDKAGNIKCFRVGKP